jgi:hypothetical protein
LGINNGGNPSKGLAKETLEKSIPTNTNKNIFISTPKKYQQSINFAG